MADGRINIGIGLDTSSLASDAEESKRILQGIGNTAKQEGDSIDASMKKIGTAVAGYFAVSKIKDFAVQVANVRGEFQQLEMAFKTMLGSADKADALMSQLIKTAATTPFGMNEVANGAKQLLAYGVQANEVNDTLIRLGDIAAGLSIPLNDLAYLYGTTMVQGRLYTQDLNQFLGRGIPLTDELAKQFGVTKDKVKELVTQGKVGFPEVQQAIINMTSEGSKFGGLMAEQSQTITGQISNIEDSIEQMFNELGKSSEGVISDILGFTSSAIDHWQEIGKVLLTVIAAYGTYKAAVIAVAAAHKIAAIWETAQAFIGLTKYVTSAKDAMLLFNMVCKANPIGLVVSILGTAAVAMSLFANNTDKADEELKATNETIKKQEERLTELSKHQSAMTSVNEEVSKSVAEEVNKIDLLQHAIHDETASLADRRKAINELHAIVPNYHATLTDEGVLYEKNRQSVDDYIDSLQRLATAKALQTKREELTQKKIAAELNRRTSSRDKEDQQKNLDAAQQAYDKSPATKKYSSDVQSSLNIGGREGHAMVLADNATSAAKETRRLQKNVDVAKAKVKKANNDIRIADAQIKEANDGIAEIDAYVKEKKIDLTSTDTKETTTTTPPKKTGKDDKQQLADQAAERTKAIQDYKNSVIAANKQAEFEIRQADIDNMEDSYEKSAAQIQLNYDRLIEENEKRKQDMLNALADSKVNEWLNENPKATKEQQIAYRKSLFEGENALSTADLTDEQQKQLQEYVRIANETKVRAEKEALNTLLQEFASYEQQRLKIAEEYADKRNALYERDSNGNVVNDENGKPKLKDGVTQGNLDELNRSEEEALKDVDEQFAQREETYKAWCNSIADMTLEQLTALLTKAEEELKALEAQSGTGQNSQKLAVARSKVSTLKTKVSQKNAETDTNPDKRSIKEWEDLYKTLTECEREFESIGDAIGGTVGEIIQSAGQIASSALTMVNGIVQLSQGSAQAIKGTAKASAAAISTMEKASVILTVISAALQIATQIASMFNDDEEKQEHIEELQDQIDALQWQLDNEDVVRLQERYGTAIDNMNTLLAKTREELAADAKSVQSFATMWEYLAYKVSQHQELIKQTAAEMAKAYANVEYSANKALGEAKYSEAQEQLENIAQQQLLIQEQIDTERSKKDADSGQITEWEEKIEELGAEAVEIINELVEDIMGGSSSDIAEELSDAFFEAFENGEDAAEAWGDKVNDIVADIVKNLMVQKFLEEPLGEIFDKYKAQWFKDGKFVGIDAVMSSLADLTSDLNATYDNFSQVYDILDMLPDELREKILGESTREATSTGIANASQESVDELNGRATAIQGHTYSINENTKILVSTTGAILQSVINIEHNTDTLPTRLAAMEANLATVKDTVNDIVLKGIKIK